MDLTSMYPETASLPSLSPAAWAGIAIPAVILCIVELIAMAKMFKKAGKPGWHVIIPFLNVYDLFDIAWGKGILFLLTFIPGVNFVIMIILYIKLAKAFGKGGGFALGLLLLPFIFTLILGFGSAQYVGPDGVSSQPQVE